MQVAPQEPPRMWIRNASAGFGTLVEEGTISLLATLASVSFSWCFTAGMIDLKRCFSAPLTSRKNSAHQLTD